MHEVQKPPDHFLYGSNLLGVYNKNLGTTKFQYKMSSTFYFNHTFTALAAPNWSLPPFFPPIRNAAPPRMQQFLDVMLNPVGKLGPFPLGTTAELRKSPHWILLVLYKQNTSCWGCLRHSLFENCIVKTGDMHLENLVEFRNVRL